MVLMKIQVTVWFGLIRLYTINTVVLCCFERRFYRIRKLVCESSGRGPEHIDLKPSSEEPREDVQGIQDNTTTQESETGGGDIMW